MAANSPLITSEHINKRRDGLAMKAEYWQTDHWVIDETLEVELLTQNVVDPCTGDGRWAKAAKKRGYNVYASDLYDWGYGDTGVDFFKPTVELVSMLKDGTALLNAPFSKSCEFVDWAFELGARKVICLQRSAWKESGKRMDWWERRPPNRQYECVDRVKCWVGTIPESDRKGGVNRPHTVFVWERGQPKGTIVGRLYDRKRRIALKEAA